MFTNARLEKRSSKQNGGNTGITRGFVGPFFVKGEYVIDAEGSCAVYIPSYRNNLVVGDKTVSLVQAVCDSLNKMHIEGEKEKQNGK